MKEAYDRNPDLSGSQPEKPKSKFLLPECHCREGTWHIMTASGVTQTWPARSGCHLMGGLWGTSWDIQPGFCRWPCH